MPKYLDETGLAQVSQNIDKKVENLVPRERTVNSYPLANNIQLTAQDVGGISMEQMNTAIKTAVQDTWNSAY